MINRLDLISDTLQPIYGLFNLLRPLFKHSDDWTYLLIHALVDLCHCFLVLFLHFEIRIDNIDHFLGSKIVRYHIFLICEIDGGSDNYFKVKETLFIRFLQEYEFLVVADVRTIVREKKILFVVGLEVL